jgi:hypothetical protein
MASCVGVVSYRARKSFPFEGLCRTTALKAVVPGSHLLSATAASSSLNSRRAPSRLKALALLRCCERPSRAMTATPVGLCTARTALAALFWC